MILTENDKSLCSGCSACAQRCPTSAILMNEDEKGFLYPQVDESACINCRLCENVCPLLNESVRVDPISCVAGLNPDEEVRLLSSSGGVFSLISQKIIKQRGVVFGALFDEQWQVLHGFVDTIDGLASLRGSKYVQSAIGNSFITVEKFLKEGKEVLFSGTPCQIYGLRCFLRKSYDNLLMIEVACHGVPSPKVWREYIRKELSKGTVTDVVFRSKSTGWKDYSVRIGKKSRRHDYDDYIGCFLGNYSLRPSCFNCKFKAGKSGADIMIADFWGIHTIAPDLDDDKGISLVISYSNKGQNVIDSCGMKYRRFEYSQVVKANPSIDHSAAKPKDYDAFWNMFCEEKPCQAIRKYGRNNRPGFMYGLMYITRKVMKQLGICGCIGFVTTVPLKRTKRSLK